MNGPKRHAAAWLLGLSLLTLGISACSGLLRSDPSRVFLLETPTAEPASGASGWSLVVAEPLATRGLGGDRIAVFPDALEMEVYAGARWADRSTLMLQHLLVDTLRATSDLDAVAVAGQLPGAALKLYSELHSFEARIQGDGSAQVRVRLELMLSKDGKNLASTSVAAERPAAGLAAEQLVAAFDEATGASLLAGRDWLIAQLAAHPKATSDANLDPVKR